VSHLKEREEKNCLNCNAQVYGKFCHICGQENIRPKESAWHLFNHFFQDVTHFDGKFFSTLILLITNPGFLSTEYASGRRINYLNPIRMYVFTSALFFLIFFSFVQKDNDTLETDTHLSLKKITKQINDNKDAWKKSAALTKDSAKVAAIKKLIKQADDDLGMLQKDSTAVDKVQSISTGDVVLQTSTNYNTIGQYDSTQKSLKADKQDSWIEQKIERKLIMARKKYGDNNAVQKAMMHKFKHSFPQILFLSLPLFALTLKVLYIRRKEFYYANHLIFSIHLYCAIFILLLIYFGIIALDNNLHWVILKWIAGLFIAGMFFYEYKAIRNFYQQRRFTTIIKYSLLNILMFIVTSFLILGMLLFTAFQI